MRDGDVERVLEQFRGRADAAIELAATIGDRGSQTALTGKAYGLRLAAEILESALNDQRMKPKGVTGVIPEL